MHDVQITSYVPHPIVSSSGIWDFGRYRAGPRARDAIQPRHVCGDQESVLLRLRQVPTVKKQEYGNDSRGNDVQQNAICTTEQEVQDPLDWPSLFSFFVHFWFTLCQRVHRMIFLLPQPTPWQVIESDTQENTFGARNTNSEVMPDVFRLVVVIGLPATRAERVQ